MKSVNAAVRTAIRSNYEVKALPRLTVEWNMNRLFDATVTNTPSEEASGYDPEVFPIESIIKPNRPSKGINKARADNALVADGYTSPDSPRFYVASPDDEYKYWTSPFVSDSSGNISGVAPQVIYSGKMRVNKIVVGLENTWASPSTWSIQVTNDGGATWSTASSAPVIANDGRATIYWNGSSWSSTKPSSIAADTEINGVKVVVTRLGAGRDRNGNVTTYMSKGVSKNTTGATSYFNLIEISPRLQRDFSDRLISTSDTFDAGGPSTITPVGTITSNVADVSLWNGDGLLSSQGGAGTLIEPNVEMSLEYLYYLNGTTYPVQQFKMYVETWEEDSQTEVRVNLSDFSKYLKEVYPPKAKYENLTLAQIIYRVCDSVGFSDYSLSTDMAGDFRIPIFWTTGETTVWEVFDELAAATQSLVYFDAYGKLNVKTREKAFDKTQQPVWTLRANKSGTDLPDIEELSPTNEYGANIIKVNYKSANWSGEVNGFPKMTTVWSPEDSVTLRATQLTAKLTTTGEYISISPEEAKHWPYEGHVQIGGEFIEYSGKWFKYLDGSTWKTELVYSHKEYEQKNEKTSPTSRHKNQFLGRLKVKERGVWDTVPLTHNPEAEGWTGKRYNLQPNNSWSTKQFHKWQKNKSSVRISHGGGLKNTNQYAMLLRGNDADTGWSHMGTRFKFHGNKLAHRGGIVFNHRNNGEGYYVELRPTNSIENKDRASQNEITLYSIKDGKHYKISSGNPSGDLIVADLWHDIDIYYHKDNHSVVMYLDGKRIYKVDVPAGRRHTSGGKFGVFIRGKSDMEIEYFYAVAGEPREPLDNAGFYDRVRGGFVGDMWTREWVYKKKSKTRWVKRKGKNRKVVTNFRQNQQFFDDFGPYVHEVREFNVEFDPAPVAHSRMVLTNDWSVVCPEYRSTAFGAYFILANSARQNAVVNGDDGMTFALSGDTVDQKLMVIGRPVIIGEQEEVEVRNEAQIRSRGEKVVEIDSEWLQSEEAARTVADWIEAHWSKGVDEVSVNVFGNPLFEVGDLVAVDYAQRGYAPTTHQYFVTSVRTSFDSGIKTELVLQRKN